MSRNNAHHNGVIRIISANHISDFAFLSNMRIEILICIQKFIRAKTGKIIGAADNSMNFRWSSKFGTTYIYWYFLQNT